MATSFGFDRDAVLAAAAALRSLKSELESSRRQTGPSSTTGSGDVDRALQGFTDAAIRHQSGLTAAVDAAADLLNDVVVSHAQLDSSLGGRIASNQPPKGKSDE
ncbi:hypothetical protein [Micromonospora foliorum]|uniref:hypothetical protein n=1 Tax=Micromonospora foliorum TaxID=2911210 RepID=UPI001EE83AAA|nr:hypothetical protein [Micromonospora foliorum]MCG5436396.1 hypothetical protein [Micromonospora foliorum]